MDPSRTPPHIGHYEIEKKIGAGGMGTVYLGRHVETGQPAAVKVLPASFARSEGSVARFTREIEALKQLTNPHVVELYESGVDEDDTYFYAMEYVEGETLTDRLDRENRIGWREAIEITLQICSALKSAHDTGIIHRDLKPSNLLITPEGTVKLTDFGVAQLFAAGRLTATGGVIGTAEYMSPEQAQGRRVTKQSDLYSLGAVMYAMLTGRPPFRGKTALDIVQKHKFARFDRPGRIVPDLPHWLDEVVCQLLEKDPEKRIPDAYVLSRRLQEVVKKVELSMREQTVSAEEIDGLAPTVDASVGRREQGMATVMRDLVRAEVEGAQQAGPVQRFFDNTWVLVGMLALLILGGVLFFGRDKLSPEERFDEGVALMQQAEGPAWIRARNAYFEPLLELDDEKWQPRVQPYLDQIARYELVKELTNSRRIRPDPDPPGEMERFLQRALDARERGDLLAAEKTLAALAALIENDPEYADELETVKTLLTEIAEQRKNGPERHQLLERSLARAEELAAAGDPHQVAAAERIWKSIIELYGNDREAAGLVARARRSLEAVSKPSQ